MMGRSVPLHYPHVANEVAQRVGRRTAQVVTLIQRRIVRQRVRHTVSDVADIHRRKAGIRRTQRNDRQ